MLSRERMEKVLEGKQPDYIPIFPKISHATCRAVEGMTMRDYMTDPGNMAKAIIAAAEKYQWDAVGITTDIANEGMAIGSKYIRPEEETSKLTEYYLEELDEYERVKVTNPWETEPTKTILRASEIVKKEIGDRIYVTAWCNAPLNVASQLIPMEELLVGMLTDPETLHELLERCLAYTVNYIKYLAETGVDAISFGHAMASNTVISAQNYEEFALPYETRLVSAIHDNGVKAITHICGDIHGIADRIARNGSDIIDFDHLCDVTELKKQTGKVLRGNIDPSLLANGTAQEVYNQTAKVVQEGKKGGNFILGSGCEVTATTPPENLKAFVQAGRDFGNCKGV